VKHYSIEDLSSENIKDWDNFNAIFKNGSFYHTIKWKNVLEKSFRFKQHCFLIRYKEKVISICPFFEVTIKGFKGLQLLPESDYNYLLLEENHLNVSIIKMILDKTQKIINDNKLSFNIVHTNNKKYEKLFDKYNYLPYPITGNMEVDIRENSPDKIWNEIFSRKDNQRKYIKRFDSDGFKIKEINSKKDIEIFYKYYKENLEFIKAPFYSYSHFKNLLNTYSSDEMRITVLHKDEVIAGGLLAFQFPPKKTMYLRYLSLNRSLPNKYHAPFYLYWDAILKASQMKYNKVSFGGTPNNREEYNYRLKKKFGCAYKDIYSFIVQYSTKYKLGDKIYRFIKKI
jgi:hypothetical protein